VEEPPPRSPASPWTRPRLLALAGVGAVALLAYARFAGGGLSESHLDLLPANSAFVLVADVERIHDSDLAETVRAAFGDAYERLVEKMREETGFGPTDVAHVVFGGDPSSGKPTIVVVMKEDLDGDALDRVAKSLRLRDEPRDVEGGRLWSRSSRQALGWPGDNVLVLGPTAEVERALRGGGGRSPVVERLVAEGGLDASLAVAFDWTVSPGLRRELERSLPGLATLLAKHVGPFVGHVDVGDTIAAEARLYAPDGDVVARYNAEVDGDFLAALLTDLATTAMQPRRRRPAPVRIEQPAPTGASRTRNRQGR